MNCISCGRSSFNMFSEKSFMNLPVFHCSYCNLYITGSSENEVMKISKRLYSKPYWDDKISILSDEPNFKKGFNEYQYRQWKSQYEYCKTYLIGKKLLEIGSGRGQSLLWFEEIGFTVIGIEPDKRNVETITPKLKHGKCIHGFIEDIDTDDKFDVIWVSHVLEHVVRPDLLLQKCKNLLSDGGFIFIEVPDCENPVVLHDSIHDNPSTFHFTKNSLKNIAIKAGYKIIRCDSLRLSSRTEARIQAKKERYLNFMKLEIFPYYPFHVTTRNNGWVIRLILL